MAKLSPVAADLRLLSGLEEIRRGRKSWSLAGPESIVVDEDGLLRTSATEDWALDEGD